MARRHRIGDALTALAGAHPEVLEAAPGARARFVALGGVLLSTGGLAVLSAAFAVHMALGAWWPVALLVGLGWGAVIVNLDRMLLVGMAHDSSAKRNAVLAVPRVALALVLGTVIATPLTLQVFHEEIDTKVVALQAEQSDAYKKSLDSDARFRNLPALKSQVQTERAIVASGGRNDPALADVHARVTAAQSAYDDAVASYQKLDAQAQCELNGTCGTGQPGTGTAYESARAAADAQAAVVASAKSALDAAQTAATDAESRSAAQASGDLAADQRQLATLTSEQARLQAAFDATNSDDDGILIRLQALSRLSDENATLHAAHLMLSLLFICIELLPVLMKVLLNFGPPTAYDELVHVRDRSDVEIEGMQQEARRAVEQAQQELYVMAEQERVDRQRHQVEARRRAAEAEAEVRRITQERTAQRRVAELLAAEDRETERRAAQLVAEEAGGRRPWDTGPILTAAARRFRTVTRRTDREPAGV
jgi:Domain of unknown function (DUF4407)